MCENNTFLQNNVSKFSKSVQQTCKLSSIAKVERGKFSIRPRNNPAYYGGYMPFVQTGDISASNKLLMKYSQTLNDKGVSVSKIFPAGTILITIAANIGDVAITTFPVACPDSVVGIAAKKCNMHWLYYVLNSKKHILNALATQNAQKNINLEILNSLKIKTSPLPEQEKIAEILSCWDDAIEQLTDLIAEKKRQKHGLMQQLLTGKQRLPGFNKPWKNVKLGDVGKITSAGVDKKIIEGEKKVRLLNYMDVYRNTFITDNTLSMVVSAPDKKIINCNLNKGDIFFTPSSETRSDIAHSAVVVEDIKDAVYSYHIVRLRLTQNMDLCFSGYIFDIESFYKQAYCLCEGSGQRYVLTQDYFRNMCVYIPSDISEQKAIANVLMTADTEIDQLNKKLDVLKEQKKGLMQKLLTGQIRVKVDKK